MSVLILKSRRVVQPDGPVSIDWASPLTNGLTQAYRHDFGLYTQDAVSGAFVALSESTGMASSVSVAGKGIARTGSSTTLNQGFFTLPVTVPAGGDCTYLVVHSPNAASGSQALIDDDNASSSRVFQFRLNAAATEFIWFSTAGSAFTASIASSVSARALNVSLAVKRGSTLKVVNNGRISSSATITGTPRTQNSVLREFNRKGPTYSPYQGSHSLAAMWGRALSDAELIALSTNPWQLFKPIERRIWVPVSAGGGQTISPPVLTRTKTLHGPSISPGSVDLAPSLVTRSKVLYEPSVSQGGAEQIIVPGLLTRTKTIPSPVVVPGEVDLAPSLLTRTKTIHEPSVSTGTALAPTLLTRSKTLYPPTVGVSGVTLSPSLLTRGKVIYFPTLTGGDVPVATGGLFWPTVRRRRR